MRDGCRGLRGLAYYGGKRPSRSLSRWIAAQLPQTSDCTYIEPFAGMLGVLLRRRAAEIEIVNDLNGDLVNWWKCIRDSPDEMERLAECTPYSREVCERAAEDLRAGDYGEDRTRRALDFHIIVEQSMMHGGGRESAGGWGTGFRAAARASTPLPFRQLADRLREVQIERRDALEVLERAASVEGAVIYADPPYSGADTEPYGADVDREKLGEILRIQKGRVAISGYGDEWDRLGWRREEFEWSATPGGASMARGAVPRTEVLWCNYAPEASGLLGI